jgi:hypothetical protein
MTSNLPNGTATFLLNDIEGSTRLSQEYAEAMPALVECVRSYELSH